MAKKILTAFRRLIDSLTGSNRSLQNPNIDKKYRRKSQGPSVIALNGLAGNYNKLGCISQTTSKSLAVCETQWTFGDWQNLAKWDVAALTGHPERANMAVLAAAGNAQLGRNNEARELISAAIDWGLDRKIAVKFLIAGVHNNLGRASIIADMQSRANDHRRQSLSLIPAKGEIELIVNGSLGFRQHRERHQVLKDLNVRNSDEAVADDDPNKLQRIILDGSINRLQNLLNGFVVKGIVSALISGNQAEKFIALELLGNLIRQATTETHQLRYELLTMRLGDVEYKFVHVVGDYIPGKIASMNDFYEGDFLKFLSRFYSSNSCIIDCGANIGNHTIYFAKELGAQTISIEPEPHNSACLRINSALNRLEDKVRIFHTALGSDVGEVTLAMSIGNNFGSFGRVGDMDGPTAMEVTVPVITIDKLIAEANLQKVVSIIKIDVEGMELDILRGASELISRDHPAVAVESSSNDAFLRVEHELHRYGYYPVEVMNATPTFLFLAKSNELHTRKLKEYLRDVALRKAGFFRP